MAQPYYPLYFNWIEDTQELSDDEKGRLIDAIVLYARGDDWQDRIQGNEKYVFPLYKSQVERAKKISAARAEAGSRGGYQTQSASKHRQVQANDGNAKQIQANGSKLKQNDHDGSKIPNKNIQEEYKEEHKEKEIEEEEDRTRERLIDPEWKMVADAYQQQIGMLPMGNALDVLISYVEDLHGETVVKAIELTNEKTPDHPYPFLMAILKAFAKNGIDSKEKAEAYVKDRERRIDNDARSRTQIRGAYQGAETIRSTGTAAGNADGGEDREKLSPSERRIRESFKKYLESTHI